MLDRLSITINLVRRGVQLETYICPLCKKTNETIQHLFINCVVVWDACERWIGTAIIRHYSILSHYHHFCLPMLTKNGNHLWKIMWVTIVTKTWAHRNKVVFRNGIVDNVEIFSLAHIRR